MIFGVQKWIVYALVSFLLLAAACLLSYRIGHGDGERGAEAVCLEEKQATQIAAISNNTKSTAIGNEYETALAARDADLANLVRDQTCVSVNHSTSGTSQSGKDASKPVGGRANAVNSATLYRFAGQCEGWRVQLIAKIKEGWLVRAACQGR